LSLISPAGPLWRVRAARRDLLVAGVFIVPHEREDSNCLLQTQSSAKRRRKARIIFAINLVFREANPAPCLSRTAKSVKRAAFSLVNIESER
jgi:hypothetical protein